MHTVSHLVLGAVLWYHCPAVDPALLWLMTTGQPNKFTCVIDFSEQHTQCRSFLEKKKKGSEDILQNKHWACTIRVWYVCKKNKIKVCGQCGEREKTFMVHQTCLMGWDLYILYKFVKSLVRHLDLAIRHFSPTLPVNFKPVYKHNLKPRFVL